MGSPLYNGDQRIWINPWQIVMPGDLFLDVLQLADNEQSPYSSDYHIRTTPWFGGPSAETVSSELPLKKYKTIIDTLKGRGYKPNNWGTTHQDEYLHIFTYDWRKSLIDLADSLARYIDSVKKWTGTKQVNLIGHSMDGLVAKSYLAKYGETNTNQIIFLGTPHLGAPEMAYAQMTGSIVNWKLRLAVNKQEIKKLAKNFPSCYQLMPNEQYFNLAINNSVSVGLDLYSGYINTIQGNILDYYASKNQWLSAWRDDSPEFNAALIEASENVLDYIWQRPIDSILVFNITGYGLPTIGEVTPFPQEITVDGKPSYYATLDGDGTVPLRSAERVSSAKVRADYYARKVGRLALCQNKEVLHLVANLLQSPPQTDLTGFTEISQEPPSSYKASGLFFKLGSPVQIHIYDDLNRHTGPNSDSTWEIGIPESYVTAGPLNDPEAEKIVVLPPGPEYRAVIYSPDSSTYYSLTLDYIIDGKKIKSLSFDSIVTPALAVSRIAVSNINSQLKVEVDTNQDGLADYYVYPNCTYDEFYLQSGWNLTPLSLMIGKLTVNNLYHHASSPTFIYNNMYLPVDSLPYQSGYWLKLAKADTLRLFGRLRLTDSINVNKGWNIIGAISIPIPTATITSQPEGIIASSFYGYNNKYFIADTLMPTQAYWLKVTSKGKLFLK